MNPRSVFSLLHPTLAVIFLFMLALMTVFELAKQYLMPGISIWESHVVTILFTSIIAVVIVYVPLAEAHRERRRATEALAHQNEAEERLRKSEMQYRTFVESVEDSIYTVDRNLRYLLFNTRYLQRRGLLPEGSAGKSYGDIHTPEETRIFRDEVMRVIATKSVVQAEYEQKGRFYLRKLNPVIDPKSSDVIAVTVISADITRGKTAEKNLAAINRKLNLMNEITRHDILNQLSVLYSYLTLAGEQSAEETTKNYLAKCEHVADTINAQILFTRDYQKIGIEAPQWQNVCAAIQRARQPLKIQEVVFEGTLAGVEILADPLLEKVFFNLMENALRYAGTHATVRFSCTEEERCLKIVCEDNGPGIPFDQKEKIFTRGFGKNTGLGLFLIQEILSITGITIYENGEPGVGSRFEMVVPAGQYRRKAS